MDPTGYDAFYGAHFRAISVQLYAYFGDAADAADLTQEAFCRAWERWDVVRGYDDPAAWVRRVAWRLAVSRWRRARVARSHSARLAESVVVEFGGDHVDLVRGLAALPGDQRRAVVLHYLADLSVAEIAADADVTVNTVKSWLHRGRAALRQALSDGSSTWVREA
ncbi:RNA polymerase sigma factor [Cryptosporangium phraense]|uniref:RNA polymerase sigma factor n=1 Tax=Cryptosporangium phraense TaxID=2593070 RepID=UPI00197AEB1D|nr:SigE family RNA polymerase sigma factor [Cryptosporangium phraense]